MCRAERRLVLENSGRFWHFTFDWQFNPRLARKPEPEQGGSRLYRLIKGHAEPWLRIPHADETTTWPLLFNRAGDAFRIRDLVGLTFTHLGGRCEPIGRDFADSSLEIRTEADEAVALAAAAGRAHHAIEPARGGANSSGSLQLE